LSGGFDSFHSMRGAKEFLATIEQRESALMREMLGEGG
jgi:hypothetical protein